MRQKDLLASLNHLQNYVEHEHYKGYDPYDVLTSPIRFDLLGKWGPIIATQIQKRNPFNIRPLLGIKKEHNPKGLGLLLHGYCILQTKFPEENYLPQIKALYQLLLEKKTKGFHGTCWGYNFGWASPVKYLPPFAPTVVATGFIAKGLFAYYQLTKDDEIKKLLLSIAPFILEDLPLTETEDGVCISYSPYMHDCCYNASLLAAETLAILYTLDPVEKYKELAIKAVNFVVSYQHSDGHWGYSLHPKSGKERTQTDFHQGYILESINHVCKLLLINNDKINNALKKGLLFYTTQQFDKNGRSLWRLPHKFPTEIHNQSQGIITLCRMKNLDKNGLQFADQIATWTIYNMQDRKYGYFYYRKNRLITNKISFMRWSNAWMFLALSELIQPTEK